MFKRTEAAVKAKALELGLKFPTNSELRRRSRALSRVPSEPPLEENAMAKPQPVPPANRSPKGPGDDGRKPKDDSELHQKRDENIEQQGDRANVKQNKTPQIQQPDR